MEERVKISMNAALATEGVITTAIMSREAFHVVVMPDTKNKERNALHINVAVQMVHSGPKGCALQMDERIVSSVMMDINCKVDNVSKTGNVG